MNAKHSKKKNYFDTLTFLFNSLIHVCVCVFVHSSGRFSESLMEMMKKFAKDVYSVSTQNLMLLLLICTCYVIRLHCTVKTMYLLLFGSNRNIHCKHIGQVQYN